MTSAKTALSVAVAVSLVSAVRTCAAPTTASKTANSVCKSAAAAFKTGRGPSKASASTSKVPAKSAASTKLNSQTGIELKGKSALFGPYSMQVGKGINIRAKFGFTIWSLDKSNEVNMLNAENKVFFRDTQEGWLRWNRRGIPPIYVTEVELIDKPAISGQPCAHYLGYQMVRNAKVCVAEFTCLQKAPCDQKVLEFWCKHYLLPPKYGFPIKVKQRVGDELDIVLETNSVRNVSVPAVAFQVPKDYNQTKDKAGLYFGNIGGGMSNSDMESFFQQPLK